MFGTDRWKVHSSNSIFNLDNKTTNLNIKVWSAQKLYNLIKDGTIRDLYKERIDRYQPKTLNENGMSLGVEVTYGDFRFVCCGDFSDNWTLEDGTKFEIEDALSEAIRPAHVSKINHLKMGQLISNSPMKPQRLLVLLVYMDIFFAKHIN